MVAADARDHVIADDHRRHGGGVVELRIGERTFQRSLPVRASRLTRLLSGVSKNSQLPYMPDAAIADRAAGVRRVLVVPKFAAGARVGRPHVVGRR